MDFIIVILGQTNLIGRIVRIWGKVGVFNISNYVDHRSHF